jgi:hypothetical protein
MPGTLSQAILMNLAALLAILAVLTLYNTLYSVTRKARIAT